MSLHLREANAAEEPLPKLLGHMLRRTLADPRTDADALLVLADALREANLLSGPVPSMQQLISVLQFLAPVYAR